MTTPPQWKYVSRDLIITYQDIHRLAVRRGTRVERQHSGWGDTHAVHWRDVELLSPTQALFDHDKVYRFIWISNADLTSEKPT